MSYAYDPNAAAAAVAAGAVAPVAAAAVDPYAAYQAAQVAAAAQAAQAASPYAATFAQPRPAAYAQPAPAAYYTYQAAPALNPDEVRTIFVTGFPDDVKERELNNLLRFLPGYEVGGAWGPGHFTSRCKCLANLCCNSWV